MQELQILYSAARQARLTADEHKAVDEAAQKLAEQLKPKEEKEVEKKDKK